MDYNLLATELTAPAYTDLDADVAAAGCVVGSGALLLLECGRQV